MTVAKKAKRDAVETKATVVFFEFEKETKNTIRFKEVTEDGVRPIIGALYLSKEVAGDAKSVKVTVEV